ncbi:MAG: DUF1538 domain-containing protein [Methanomicrobiaceae archaeon]|nr:DUF1538 domain-containing protein [Methanomicrobiaceae archaeon]
MMHDYKHTFREVTQAILPILLVILLVQIFLLGSSTAAILQFLIGAVMMVFGIALFLIGVRVGLLPMGEAIGAELPKSGSILLILVVSFLFGLLTTVAEPDVRVLTTMIDTVSNGSIAQTPLVLVIAVGVGFFVATAMLRIIYRVPILYLFTAGYGAIILLSFFTSPEFLPIAFDAGGVTTGPITVPFILALGIGVTSVMGGRSALSEGFGLIGLASIGPILGVMLLGVVMPL